MTGFQSKQAAAQAKLTEDDDIQDYKRPWVGLTDEDLKPLCDEWRLVYGGWTEDFARAIEQALKAKNT